MPKAISELHSSLRFTLLSCDIHFYSKISDIIGIQGGWKKLDLV